MTERISLKQDLIVSFKGVVAICLQAPQNHKIQGDLH